jgi:hypothetical protein
MPVCTDAEHKEAPTGLTGVRRDELRRFPTENIVGSDPGPDSPRRAVPQFRAMPERRQRRRRLTFGVRRRGVPIRPRTRRRPVPWDVRVPSPAARPRSDAPTRSPANTRTGSAPGNPGSGEQYGPNARVRADRSSIRRRPVRRVFRTRAAGFRVAGTRPNDALGRSQPTAATGRRGGLSPRGPRARRHRAATRALAAGDMEDVMISPHKGSATNRYISTSSPSSRGTTAGTKRAIRCATGVRSGRRTDGRRVRRGHGPVPRMETSK